MFPRLRRAARLMVNDTKVKFMIVFTATTSIISNFVPTVQWDKPQWPLDKKSEEGLFLFHPFILRKSFDALIQRDGINSGRPLLSRLLEFEEGVTQGDPWGPTGSATGAGSGPKAVQSGVRASGISR